MWVAVHGEREFDRRVRLGGVHVSIFRNPVFWIPNKACAGVGFRVQHTRRTLAPLPIRRHLPFGILAAVKGR